MVGTDNLDDIEDLETILQGVDKDSLDLDLCEGCIENHDEEFP